MHTYSTDNDKRPLVYAILGVTAYLALGFIGSLTKQLSTYLPIVAGIGVTWTLLFGVALALFNFWGWKTRVPRWLNLVRVPDLNGCWKGYIQTSYQGDNIPDAALHESNNPETDMSKLTAVIEIDQNWRKLNVHLETESSSSDSSGATILTNDGRWPSLSYQYENEPDPNTSEEMVLHYGTANLERKREGNCEVLEGFYYTGPGRGNYGKMRFEQSAE